MGKLLESFHIDMMSLEVTSAKFAAWGSLGKAA